MALDQFILDNFAQSTSIACLSDLTPPTFGGVTGLVANANGSLTASWSAATDTSLPVQYDVYIQPTTATGLFVSGNKALSTFGLNIDIFELSDLSLLLNGVVYFVGVRARDAIGNVNPTTASMSATSQGVPSTSILNAIAGIWDQLRASHVVSGSFGEALQGVFSPTRAGYVDLIPAIKTKTDNLPADPASNTTVNTRAPASTALDNTVWTNAKAAFIDVAISSRNAVAPDNASITAIKAKTDNLPADPASNTQVNTRAPASTALDNTVWTNAKAAFIDAAISSRSTAVDMATALTALANIYVRTDVATSTRATPADVSSAVSTLAGLINSVAGDVWEEVLTAHTSGGTFGAQLQNPVLDMNDIAIAVWDAAVVAHTVAGSFGLNAQTPSLNPSQVASAVWDALTSAHTVAGSFGLNAQTPSLNPTQVAAAVWDALISAHNISGTFGAQAQSPALTPTQIASAVWDAVLSLYQNVGSTGEALAAAGVGGKNINDVIGVISQDEIEGEMKTDEISGTVED